MVTEHTKCNIQAVAHNQRWNENSTSDIALI